MIAIEVRLNGEYKATCGAEDLSSLTAMVCAKRSRSAADEVQYSIECVGVRRQSDEREEVLRWIAARISLGDELSLKFVDASTAHPPIDRLDLPVERSRRS